jgi:hypothetical protein
MVPFIQKQIEMSERMFELMHRDHKQRMEQIVLWADMNDSLLRKLEERDKEIQRLQSLLQTHEVMEKI